MSTTIILEFLGSIISCVFCALGSVVYRIIVLIKFLVYAIGWYLYFCAPQMYVLFSLAIWAVCRIFSFFGAIASYIASIALEFPASTFVLATAFVVLHYMLWPKPVRRRSIPRAGDGSGQWRGQEFRGGV